MALTERTKNLLDLPVVPVHRDDAASTSLVQETYLQELSVATDVESPEHSWREVKGQEPYLVWFVKRWQSLWLLRDPRESPEQNILTPEEQAIVDVSFNVEEVTERLRHKKEVDLPWEDFAVRVMAHIALPRTLMKAWEVANHYEVGVDLAMVRLYLDPYPELADKLR